MKQIVPILLLLMACSSNSGKSEDKISKDERKVIVASGKNDISDPTNTLTGKTETLELHYIVWGCACANWVTPEDLKKYQDNDLDKHTIFLEPLNPELEIPFYFDPSRH